MNKSKHNNTSNIFIQLINKSIEFTNSFNDAISGIKYLLKILNTKNSKQRINNNNQKKYTPIDESKIINASYRFMHVKPGCGITKVKQRFRELVKEIRPDINTDELTKKKYIALQVARKTLIDIEK